MSTKPKKQKIVPPKGGWREGAVYLVDISWSDNNPIHRALFHTGSLSEEGEPRAYSQVIYPNGDREGGTSDYGNLRYMKAIQALVSGDELRKDTLILPPTWT